MRAVFVCLTFVAASASAETLRMHRAESTNVHMANQEGASNWSEVYTITLALGAKGKARATSKGTRNDHQMTSFKNAPSLAESTGPWVFAKRGCLEVNGGKMTGNSYSSC